MINRRKSDVERKMLHYNISRAEALAHPSKYPLPQRKFKNRRQ